MPLQELTALKRAGVLTDSTLFDQQIDHSEPESSFTPQAPQSLAEAGISEHLVESLVLKFLQARGIATGKEISTQIRLPFRMLDEFLRQLKKEQLVAHRSAASSPLSGATMPDFHYELTQGGYERAKRYREVTTYYGATPVTHEEWVASIKAQSLSKQRPTPEDLRRAFEDLLLPDKFFSQVGQAVAAAKSLFLHGLPGNGKTSIAQRICSTFGRNIWIPRSLIYDGEIVRLYDPIVHKAVDSTPNPRIDHRWIQIVRPTVIAGGELTLDQLEMTTIGTSNLVEAPLQMKSSCGLLVIDDFGRQRCSPQELLNRWIVPLETAVDYLNTPSGKKICVPFDQMIVFSTNLEPRDLVDEAFLRRIPYKVHAPNPNAEQFLEVFQHMARKLEIPFDRSTFDDMVRRHFIEKNRTFRYCHPRDLLMQIKTYCEFEDQPAQMTTRNMDVAVENYFVDL